MGCCNKAKKLTAKARNIVKGYTALIVGKKYEFTDGRVRKCQQCAKDDDGGYRLGRTLWCSVCKCLIPAKARVEEEKCPKGKW